MEFNDFRLARNVKDNIAPTKGKFYYLYTFAFHPKIGTVGHKIKKKKHRRHSRNKVYRRRGKNKKSKICYQHRKSCSLQPLLCWCSLINSQFRHTMANELTLTAIEYQSSSLIHSMISLDLLPSLEKPEKCSIFFSSLHPSSACNFFNLNLLSNFINEQWNFVTSLFSFFQLSLFFRVAFEWKSRRSWIAKKY